MDADQRAQIQTVHHRQVLPVEERQLRRVVAPAEGQLGQPFHDRVF
jgi:hypothetical protein